MQATPVLLPRHPNRGLEFLILRTVYNTFWTTNSFRKLKSVEKQQQLAFSKKFIVKHTHSAQNWRKVDDFSSDDYFDDSSIFVIDKMKQNLTLRDFHLPFSVFISPPILYYPTHSVLRRKAGIEKRSKTLENQHFIIRLVYCEKKRAWKCAWTVQLAQKSF